MRKNIKKRDGWVKLEVDTTVYLLPTIYAAGYAFLDKIHIYLDRETKNKVVVWFCPKDKRMSSDKLSKDFYNELLNYAHYFNRIKANADAIRLIMQRVLFSVNAAAKDKSEDKRVEELIDALETEKE